MGNTKPTVAHTEQSTAVDSDYGSEIDDDTWDSVLTSQSESQPLAEVAIIDLEEPAVNEHAPYHQRAALRLPRSPNSTLQAHLHNWPAPSETAVNGNQFKAQSPLRSEREPEPAQHPGAADSDDGNDARSPLQRFRTPPKKPLSVTDFVSPAWCELQYWYSLTKYGRVRRTPAMKAGTRIHKEKEREVHVEVPIEVRTQEDKLGLRLWNIIHGLRTLRSTGLTRELEVFGLVDGEVVIGIIDEITTTCPDDALEAAMLEKAQGLGAEGRKANKQHALPADQRTMNDFFASSQEHDSQQDEPKAKFVPTQRSAKTYYMVDIKTRQSSSMPQQRQMKPTRMQLMMYRRMMWQMASNNVEADSVFRRYQMDPDTSFSDTFLAELAGLDVDSSQNTLDGEAQIDSLDEITTHNNLRSLWSLMIQEFGKVLLLRGGSPNISTLLTAEYRSSKEGDLLGKKSFGFDTNELDSHLQRTLQWWRGERSAAGVEIEDAWKCGICEFAENCTWRADKIDEATQRARRKRMSTTKDQS